MEKKRGWTACAYRFVVPAGSPVNSHNSLPLHPSRLWSFYLACHRALGRVVKPVEARKQEGGGG